MMFKYLAILMLSTSASTCNQVLTKESQNSQVVGKLNIQQDTSQLHDIWALRELVGDLVDTTNFPLGTPTLEIFVKEMRLGGFSGCNNYGATIDTLTATQLRIGSIMATKKYCFDVKEKVYFELLAKCNTYKIEKLYLFLYENDRLLLTFKKVD